MHSPNLTIHVTDLAAMLPLLETNIALNPLRSPVSASVLAWGGPSSPSSSSSSIPPQPDILLAADCVYLEPTFPLLRATMRELIGGDTVCLFCFQKRRRADWGFVRGLRKVFDVREVRDDLEMGGWRRRGVFL